MALRPTVDDLLARNDATLKSFTPRPLFTDMVAKGLPLPTTIVVSCADTRICPEEFFSLSPGEAVVFRNAAGRVRTALQDIVLLDALLGHGIINQLLIVHHTDCGGSMADEAGHKANMIKGHPGKKAEIESWKTGSWDGLGIEDSVREDLAFVKDNDFFGEALKAGTRGFTFDIVTGRVSEVV